MVPQLQPKENRDQDRAYLIDHSSHALSITLMRKSHTLMSAFTDISRVSSSMLLTSLLFTNMRLTNELAALLTRNPKSHYSITGSLSISPNTQRSFKATKQA